MARWLLSSTGARGTCQTGFTVAAVAVAVALGVLLPVGVAYAGEARQIPNPGTLLLLTSGLAGLAWWLRKGK